MSDNPIQWMADDAVARQMAEYEARRPAGPTVEQLEQQINESRLRELLTQEAMLHDVRPRAIRYVVRDAEEVFELKDDAVVPRNGARDPNDPVSPLTPARWLQEKAKTEGDMFNPTRGRAH